MMTSVTAPLPSLETNSRELVSSLAGAKLSH